MHKTVRKRKVSELFHLEPMNVLNGSVESLTSYLSRLSEAHSLPVQSLIDEIIWPVSTLSGSGSTYKSSFYRDYSKTINGVGEYAAEFSRVIQKLTLRSELRCLTMLPLDGVIDSVGKGLLKRTKEWCPLCYKEQMEEYGFMYDQLRWSLSVVDCCHKHKVKLSGVCHECGKRQWPLVRYTPLGYCLHCGSNLSRSYNSINMDEYISEWSEWDDWVDRNLKAVFNNSKELDQNYKNDDFCIALEKLVCDVSNGNALQLDRKLGFGEGTITQWRRGRNKPRFDYLLQFAYRLRMDLFEVLKYERKNEVDTPVLLEKLKGGVEFNIKDRKNYRHDEIEKELDRVLCGKSPESAASIVKRLGVTKGYLNYRFPEKIRMISENYKKHVAEEHARKFNDRRESIRTAILRLHKQGVYPSRRNVFKQAEGVCEDYTANHPLRAVWREEMIRLGYLD